MITRRALLASSALAAAQTGNRPNVIVIVTDDQGCHDLGCLGATDLKTPNIDALAAFGARFVNWYSNAPVCAPSRSSINTGRFPIKAGVPANGAEIPPGTPTIATTLKSAGYATGAFGKWHLGSSDNTRPNAHGFDYYYGFLSGCVDFYSHRYYWGEPRLTNYHDLWRNRTEIFEDGQYLTERITAEVTGFIRQNRARPFFAYCAYNAPHYPMHAPAKYLERFPSLAPERRTYAAMIAAVDDGVGEIRRALEQAGLLDNTLIFYIADNGATTEKRAGLGQNYATAGGNGAFRGFKFSLFDGGMHVPGIVSWPRRVPKGQVIHELAMSMDILPTICEAAGVAVPSRVDGKSILAVAASKAKSPHDAIYWSNQGQTAVRRGKWKLVVNGKEFGRSPDGNKSLSGDDAMFLADLETDPGERVNLRKQHPNVVDELATLLASWERTMKE